MNPWQLIGRAQTPGGGVELVLYQRDSEFSLRADNLELMNSRFMGQKKPWPDWAVRTWQNGRGPAF